MLTNKKRIQLIDEGGQLDLQIKGLTARLKEIKTELGEDFQNTGAKTAEGNDFDISCSETTQYTDIDPIACHTALEKKGMVKLDRNMIDLL